MSNKSNLNRWPFKWFKLETAFKIVFVKTQMSVITKYAKVQTVACDTQYFADCIPVIFWRLPASLILSPSAIMGELLEKFAANKPESVQEGPERTCQKNSSKFSAVLFYIQLTCFTFE